MTWVIRTTDGVLVTNSKDNAPLTEEYAKASAEQRNAAAEELEIETRYEAVET